ncbi:MAG: MFS transporter [Caulobacteraceae bacterium]
MIDPHEEPTPQTETSTGGGEAAAKRSALESLRISPYHLLIVAVLFLAQVFAGVSMQNLPYLAPAIIRELRFDPQALGILFGISVVSSAVGAMLAGAIGDLVGPKRVTIFAVLGFGLATALSSRANTFVELALLRFVAGFCNGGAMPNVITLAAQFAPARYRATIVTTVVAGFPAGATLAGVVMTTLLAPDAWRMAFLLAGIMSVAVAPLIFVVVPEALPFLLARPGGPERARKILVRLGGSPEGPISWDAMVTRSRAPLLDIFRRDWIRTSLLLAAIFMLVLIDVYFLANWLPILMERTGASSGRALSLTAIFNFGGIVGVVLLGRLIDYIGVRRVLFTLLISGSAALAFMALAGTANAAFTPVLVIAGMAFLGGSGVLNALPALLYPPALRSTAGGWAIGAGHLGGASGPILGGYLLQAGWQPQQALLLAAVLPLLALVMSTWLVTADRARGGHQ